MKPIPNEKTGLAPVTLLKSYDVHNAGEVAGFRPEIAQKLVDRGIAKPFEAKADAPKADAPKADAKK